MTEENELNNNPKVKISNIENILPKIEEKLFGREQEQAEYEYIKTQMSTLKKDYEDMDEKYIEIKSKISELNKRAVELYLRIEPSPFEILEEDPTDVEDFKDSFFYSTDTHWYVNCHSCLLWE